MNDQTISTLADLRHDIIVGIVTFLLGFVWAKVKKGATDLHNAWERIRCYAERLKAIEENLGIECSDSCKEGECNEQRTK